MTSSPPIPARAAGQPMSGTGGRVIWITGLSGAGKTTVARLLKPIFEARGDAVVLLDGDELRGVFPLGERFDRDSRLALALGYGRLCRLLAAQGLTVICATISMRREVYAWNRENLPNYLEVFLDIAPEIRAARDPKRYYAALRSGDLKDFAGHDLDVDPPEGFDLRFTAEGGQSAAVVAARIADYVSGAERQDARARS